MMANGGLEMFRKIVLTAGVVAGAAWLGSCATMNEEQCLAGDWSGQGYADGAAGHGSSRLGEHGEACAKHGIVPDSSAYYAGHQQGVRVWCRPSNGYAVGRRGTGYGRNFCPADLEPDFLVALADGRLVHDAWQRAEEMDARVNSAQGRVDVLDSQIQSEQTLLADPALTDAQREAVRSRIRSLRDDRDREFYEIRDLRRDADNARRDAQDVENRFIPTYGG